MSRRRSTRRSRRTQAFTLIEVMMALAVMTVGAMGIMALQQATTRGTGSARSMSIATQTTRTWVERLRRDSLRWNQQGMAGLTVANGPKYLDAVPNPGEGDSGWLAPVDPAPDTDDPQSYGFDFRGRDTSTSGDMRYCTHIKLSWVNPGQTIRADVRTWWHRRGSGGDSAIADARRFADCARGSEDTVTAALAGGDRSIRAVYSSMLIRRNPLP